MKEREARNVVPRMLTCEIHFNNRHLKKAESSLEIDKNVEALISFVTFPFPLKKRSR